MLKEAFKYEKTSLEPVHQFKTASRDRVILASSRWVVGCWYKGQQKRRTTDNPF